MLNNACFFFRSGISNWKCAIFRAINGPNCWAMQPVPDRPNECNFLWLLDTDLRGWVPQYMVEAALSSAMLDFLSSLRQFAAKLKEEGKFPTNAWLCGQLNWYNVTCLNYLISQIAQCHVVRQKSIFIFWSQDFALCWLSISVIGKKCM